MASVGCFLVSGAVRCVTRRRFGVRAQSLEGGGSTVLSSESVNGSSSVVMGTPKNHNGGSLVKEEAKGWLLGVEGEKKKKKREAEEGLAALWDDGYGRSSVEDYFAAAKEICRSDGGPPRWFCPVECGPPLKDSPTLLFLPGMDGTGFGLTLHHQALGKVFEVRCLHIPVHDRTPFEGLVKLIGEAVKHEHALSPNKPIYLVGDSFGGCLAFAVAAHNPTVDLVLILCNPATSFGQSQLQPLFPILEALPDELHVAVPFVLSFIMGDSVKMASVNIGNRLPPVQKLEQLAYNLTALLPCLPELANIIPRDTLLWKLKLLKSAAAYANSRLHAVKAEVLVLASGKDNLLPSVNEAQRLAGLLSNCKVRVFKDSGHTLLLSAASSHCHFCLASLSAVHRLRRRLKSLSPAKSRVRCALRSATQPWWSRPLKPPHQPPHAASFRPVHRRRRRRQTSYSLVKSRVRCALRSATQP
ncbi:hypothetical protein LR48_Vigan09g158100 [Vigna angularis]|uniref:Serine aminopeptidase S33 domain-containing protein n=1 Tax=Phaseolus angularis TaxID=3914 RepID=A0A0L9VDB6_PHAAN|nr:hypothetical protein LR48_Vigan09g158100 [Vigna angularis]